MMVTFDYSIELDEWGIKFDVVEWVRVSPTQRSGRVVHSADSLKEAQLVCRRYLDDMANENDMLNRQHDDRG